MLPLFTFPSKRMNVVDICVFVGFAKSKSEARRLIEQGGFRVNDVKVTDPNTNLVWTEE